MAQDKAGRDPGSGSQESCVLRERVCTAFYRQNRASAVFQIKKWPDEMMFLKDHTGAEAEHGQMEKPWVEDTGKFPEQEGGWGESR